LFFFAVFNVLLSMKKSDLEICSLQISCLQRNPNSFPFVENYDFVNSKCRAHFFDLSYLTLKGLPTPENLNGLKKFNDVYRWCSNYSRESYTYTRIIHHHRIIKFFFFLLFHSCTLYIFEIFIFIIVLSDGLALLYKKTIKIYELEEAFLHLVPWTETRLKVSVDMLVEIIKRTSPCKILVLNLMHILWFSPCINWVLAAC
jgi:hypothetical protein